MATCSKGIDLFCLLLTCSMIMYAFITRVALGNKGLRMVSTGGATAEFCMQAGFPLSQCFYNLQVTH